MRHPSCVANLRRGRCDTSLRGPTCDVAIAQGGEVGLPPPGSGARRENHVPTVRVRGTHQRTFVDSDTQPSARLPRDSDGQWKDVDAFRGYKNPHPLESFVPLLHPKYPGLSPVTALPDRTSPPEDPQNSQATPAKESRSKVAMPPGLRLTIPPLLGWLCAPAGGERHNN